MKTSSGADDGKYPGRQQQRSGKTREAGLVSRGARQHDGLVGAPWGTRQRVRPKADGDAPWGVLFCWVLTRPCPVTTLLRSEPGLTRKKVRASFK